MKRWLSLLLVFLVSAATLAGQRATDHQITEAIAAGVQEQLSNLVGTCTTGLNFGQVLLTPNSVSGSYEVVLMNHLGWIAALANQNKRLYKSFSLKDVTADMRTPVIILGIAPSEHNGTRFATPVQQVVIRSKAAPTAFTTPERIDQLQNQESAALKGAVGYPYLAKFSFAKVKALPAGDFEVVLVTEAGERRCKIGQRDRSKLFPSG